MWGKNLELNYSTVKELMSPSYKDASEAKTRTAWSNSHSELVVQTVKINYNRNAPFAKDERTTSEVFGLSYYCILPASIF